MAASGRRPKPTARPRAPDALRELVEPHRRQILYHCYRMLGSWTEAEDVFQEVLLRAWRGLAGYGGRASQRTWLYQIATNACLTALRARPRRSLPELRAGPTPPDGPVSAFGRPVQWIEPAPSPSGEDDLEGSLARRESVGLAFVVALQQLSPRQRACLLLFDVVGYTASEIAAMLRTSVAGVHSTLARARTRLEKVRTLQDAPAVAPSPAHQRLLRRFLQAWEAGDVPALVKLLGRDARFSMPPIPSWFQGRRGIAGALESHVFASGNRYRLEPTFANGQPAFVLHKNVSPGGPFEPFGIQLLRIGRGRVQSVVTFLHPPLARRFVDSLRVERRVSRGPRVSVHVHGGGGVHALADGWVPEWGVRRRRRGAGRRPPRRRG